MSQVIHIQTSRFDWILSFSVSDLVRNEDTHTDGTKTVTYQVTPWGQSQLVKDDGRSVLWSSAGLPGPPAASAVYHIHVHPVNGGSAAISVADLEFARNKGIGVTNFMIVRGTIHPYTALTSGPAGEVPRSSGSNPNYSEAWPW